MAFGRHAVPIFHVHVARGKKVSDGHRMARISKSGAHVFETLILQLLFLWWVAFIVACFFHPGVFIV